MKLVIIMHSILFLVFDQTKIIFRAKHNMHTKSTKLRKCTITEHKSHMQSAPNWRWKFRLIDYGIDDCSSLTKKKSILLVPPRISPFNFEKDITEGLRTQLMCSSSQGDQPFNITWLKDQRIIFTRNSNKQHIDGMPSKDNEYGMWRASDLSSQYFVDNTIHINEYAPFSSILSIENLTSHHNGNYTCRVGNHGGTVEHTAVLSVAGSYTIFAEQFGFSFA